MTKIEKAQLPGVGVRHDFSTAAGNRIGVITHRTGRRELLIYDRADPDACSHVLRLDEEDTRALAELLGTSQVTEETTKLQSLEGLTVDWLPVDASTACAGSTLDQPAIAATGVSIVAVVRDGRTIPSPPPDFRLQAGDTAVAVGTPEGIQQAFALLRGA